MLARSTRNTRPAIPRFVRLASAALPALLPLLAACTSAPPTPDWQVGAHDAVAAFERRYLSGDTSLAERELARARAEIARSGRGDLLARVELVRCAVRFASLEFDDCPEFERFRSDAGAEELAYFRALSGGGAHTVAQDPLSRLVEAALRFKAGTILPADIGAAVEIASAQGWRRPLLAWLGVQAKRAEAAGDQQALAQIRRRIEIVSGITAPR